MRLLFSSSFICLAAFGDGDGRVDVDDAAATERLLVVVAGFRLDAAELAGRCRRACYPCATPRGSAFPPQMITPTRSPFAGTYALESNAAKATAPPGSATTRK